MTEWFQTRKPLMQGRPCGKTFLGCRIPGEMRVLHCCSTEKSLCPQLLAFIPPLHPHAFVPQFPEVDMAPTGLYLSILWLSLVPPPLSSPEPGSFCSRVLALACLVSANKLTPECQG